MAFFKYLCSCLGYGKSAARNFNKDKGDFLYELIMKLSPNQRPVLVSPSMSGTFSLDLLVKHQGTDSDIIKDLPWSVWFFQMPFAATCLLLQSAQESLSPCFQQFLCQPWLFMAVETPVLGLPRKITWSTCPKPRSLKSWKMLGIPPTLTARMTGTPSSTTSCWSSTPDAKISWSSSWTTLSKEKQRTPWSFLDLVIRLVVIYLLR